MWTGQTKHLKDLRGVRMAIEIDSRPMTYADVLRAWQSDEDFRVLFNLQLAEVSYAAFRWETPAVTTATLAQPFEFVLLDSPGLARRPDSVPFTNFFHKADDGVAVFPNLSSDAILVVPCPVASPSAYGHIAAFVRSAPEAQRHAFWKAVGDAMTRRIGTKPVWLSTAGAGVSWLHVRLDDRPKYYGYQPYRSPPNQTAKLALN